MVFRHIEATSPNCPGGIDLEIGNQAKQVLAETQTASCLQSIRIFNLATGKQPAAFLSYNDYCRLVPVGDHAGAGWFYRLLEKKDRDILIFKNSRIPVLNESINFQQS